jgi:hypothetical protein
LRQLPASASSAAMTNLTIRDFGHIRDVEIAFGDLTVLVGPQGAGKSLTLQWLKTAMDGKQIVGALRDAGQDVTDPSILIDLIFGVGMGSAWRRTSHVRLDNKSIQPDDIQRLGERHERVFFIPAHRAILVSDGWAAPFQKLPSDIPVVARLFSDNLFHRFNDRSGELLFPAERVLKRYYRTLVDQAVYHGGTIAVVRDNQHNKRLRLRHGKDGETSLPFMTWTAGQREFTPLLLGLYTVLPERKKTKEATTEWVIIEEPEMGLHPLAVRAIMLLVLETLSRGYRVVISTHSPMVLSAIWALRELQKNKARWQSVADAFEIPQPDRNQLEKVLSASLKKDLRTYAFAFDKANKVRSKDISTLDPEDSDREIAGWGGLSSHESAFGEGVRAAVIAKESA